MANALEQGDRNSDATEPVSWMKAKMYEQLTNEGAKPLIKKTSNPPHRSYCRGMGQIHLLFTLLNYSVAICAETSFS